MVAGNSLSLCVESLVGVGIQPDFYPNGGAVTGGAWGVVVTRIPCSSEHHRVQLVASCQTTVTSRSVITSAVQWLLGSQGATTGNNVIVNMAQTTELAVASIGNYTKSLLLTQSSVESSFTISWSPPSTLSLQYGAQATYIPSASFDNGVSAALNGGTAWLRATDLITQYSSSSPGVIDVDGTQGTMTLLANSHTQVTLTRLTAAVGVTVSRRVTP